jgi:hypothetical protein
MRGLLDSFPSGITAVYRWTRHLHGSSSRQSQGSIFTQQDYEADRTAGSSPVTIAGSLLSSTRNPLREQQGTNTYSSDVSKQRDDDRCLVLMSVAHSGKDAVLQFWELEAASCTVIYKPPPYRIPGCLAQTITDFLVTDHYYLVLQVMICQGFVVHLFLSESNSSCSCL